MVLSRKNRSIINALFLLSFLINFTTVVAARAESADDANGSASKATVSEAKGSKSKGSKSKESKSKRSKSKGSKSKGSKSKGSKSKGSTADPPRVAVKLDNATPLEQCDWVLSIWQKMGGYTILDDFSTKTGCCYYLGSATQSSGITGVRCRPDGTVTEIIWRNIGLTGSIPGEIKSLVNLERL
jgi:hypothetical protein